VDEPGGLTDFGAEARREWNRLLAGCFRRVDERFGLGSLVADDRGHELAESTRPDWSAYPARVGVCLGNARAGELLDRPIVGRNYQEEYCEWRAVRNDAGLITRVELTTELAAYWRVLAIHEPRRTLDLVAEFAGKRPVAPADVYGLADPIAATLKQRDAGFVQTMLSGPAAGPYNWGQRAICCLVQETNTLEALLRLAGTAARPRLIKSSSDQERLPTAAEVIPPVLAQQGRSSDPVLTERLGRLAYEGRSIGFSDPLGIYIAGVQHTRLRGPDGSAVGPDWFRLERGLGAQAAEDGQPRYQRLVFEVPAEAGFAVGELVDVATEQPIRFGAQIAELVQLAIYLRVSVPGDEVEPELMTAKPAQDPIGCGALRHQADRQEADGSEAATER
jgi:hypothetical protein